MLHVMCFMSVLALGLCLPWEGNIHKEKEECKCSEIEHIQKQNEDIQKQNEHIQKQNQHIQKDNEHLQKQNGELWQAVNGMQGMLEKHIETSNHRFERITANLQR